ncbi:MAG TPA: MerR family transcriptional regulator [Solirubrobacteraceae bacterium]|nr:MerR family transcriptional regulator [Solirubrobacteraceae bacterium]
MSFPAEGLRIGEFARRVGVSAAVLRAWERRYGLLEPLRSPGGFRLYTARDAERIGRMQQGLDQGLSAAEAARAALASTGPSVGLLEHAAERLLTAIRAYDEAAVHEVLDESLTAFGLESVLRQLIVPVLAQLGREWQQGTPAIGHEHFASNLIRARLLSLARLWGRGSGPVAVLACAPGEQHDIGLLTFGLVLRSHGWRIVFLGADTPIATLAHTAKRTRSALTVLTSFDPCRLEAESTALRRLAAEVWIVLSGPGATDPLCHRLGLQRLDGDPIAAAHEIAGHARTARVRDPAHRATPLPPR